MQLDASNVFVYYPSTSGLSRAEYRASLGSGKVGGIQQDWKVRELLVPQLDSETHLL